jgi:hypothetical protein
LPELLPLAHQHLHLAPSLGLGDETEHARIKHDATELADAVTVLIESDIFVHGRILDENALQSECWLPPAATDASARS